MRVAFLAITLVLAAIGTASAQGSGTPEDQRACSPSVKRFCVQAIAGGDFAVLSCLQQNRARIAPACRRVLTNYGQ